MATTQINVMKESAEEYSARWLSRAEQALLSTFVRRDPRVLAECTSLAKRARENFDEGKALVAACRMQAAFKAFDAASMAAKKIVDLARSAEQAGRANSCQADKARREAERRARQLQRSAETAAAKGHNPQPPKFGPGKKKGSRR